MYPVTIVRREDLIALENTVIRSLPGNNGLWVPLIHSCGEAMENLIVALVTSAYELQRTVVLHVCTPFGRFLQIYHIFWFLEPPPPHTHLLTVFMTCCGIGYSVHLRCLRMRSVIKHNSVQVLLRFLVVPKAIASCALGVMVFEGSGSSCTSQYVLTTNLQFLLLI